MQRGFWLLCPAMLLLINGCGAPKLKFPETVPFTGKVTLDGKPLPNATVVFSPAKQGGGNSALGGTDAEGKYELFVAFGTERKTGAVPGDYKVHITTMLPPPLAPGKKVDPATVPAIAKELVTGDNSSFDRTKLRVSVPAAGGKHDFELKSK